MTTLQIHLTMAALGVAVCLALVGLVSYRHPHTFKRNLLGFCVGGIVAMSPILAILTGVNREGLLAKSLLLSAATVMMGLLFYILSRWPLKYHPDSEDEYLDSNSNPMQAAAEDSDEAINTPLEETSTLESSVPTLLKIGTSHAGLATLELGSDDASDEETHNENVSADNNASDDTAGDSDSDLSGNDVSEIKDDINADLDEDESSDDSIFDVSGDEIFEAENEIFSGPEESMDTDEEITDTFDIDDAFRERAEHADTSDVSDIDSFAVAANEDDVAIDNSLIFDLTGQHEIPSDIEDPISEPNSFASVITDLASSDDSSEENELFAPWGENEDGTLSNQAITNDGLNDQNSEPLEQHDDKAVDSSATTDSIELDQAIQEQLHEIDSAIESLDTAAVELTEVDELDDAEFAIPTIHTKPADTGDSQVQSATDTMITLQRQVLEQNERQQQVIKALKEKSAAQLKLQQEETSRLRELLQNSADLTREVAGKQQEMRIAVEHEKALRLKSEASAKHALGIARTAIARLSKAKAKTTAEPTEPLTVVDSDD